MACADDEELEVGEERHHLRAVVAVEGLVHHPEERLLRVGNVLLRVEVDGRDLVLVQAVRVRAAVLPQMALRELERIARILLDVLDAEPPLRHERRHALEQRLGGAPVPAAQRHEVGARALSAEACAVGAHSPS